ncbi:MAG: hypothetical protein PHT36_01485 [Patescibacteria group bacterium]|nr:hypothetical protein [Patescibacteria group bacterium]
MNWRNFTRGLSVSTLVFGVLTFVLTIFSSPERGLSLIIVYYVSLLLFLMGLFTLIIFLLRKWWMHNEIIFTNVKASIRQGFLIALLICFLLLLSSLQLLTWWDGGILVLSFILLELFLRNKR